MKQFTVAQGPRTFLLVWAGQLVSVIGSGLTGFALSIWVYQQTSSVTQFALINVLNALTTILVSPVAGALVDRWDRRWAMILSDTGSGLSMAVILALLYAEQLQPWHIYITSVISTICNAFQWPAYAAATSLLIPKQHLGRANGMVQIGQASAQITAPLLAGVLLALIDLEGLLLIDVGTFLFSLLTLLVVRFPQAQSGSRTQAASRSLRAEIVYGWHYIIARRGLLALLILFAINNFCVGVVSVLVVPLALAFTTPTILGSILSTGGIGLLIGSVLMSVWGGPKRRITAVIGFEGLVALSMILVGTVPSVPIFAIAAFTFFFSTPFINGSSQAIWQVKVEPAVQGRVFATRRVIAQSTLPLSYLASGPLADRVFSPILMPGGLLADSVGPIFGVGPGYGLALLFLVMGVLMALVTASAYFYPGLRCVEDELPDAIGDVPAAETRGPNSPATA